MTTVPPVLEDKLATLPERPGVYLYRGADGELLYVGKAKSLRARVRSYFQPSAQHPPRVARLVSEVRDLELIVTDTEIEALILEANWIKRERPRFNVVLRDDKQFPYLMLSTRDEYPRVSLVRKARLDGNEYYGPFIPAWVARRTLKMVPRFFQVATCGEVFDGKRRPCLYFHLDQCLAPCAGKTTPEEYRRAVRRRRALPGGKAPAAAVLARSQDEPRRARRRSSSAPRGTGTRSARCSISPCVRTSRRWVSRSRTTWPIIRRERRRCSTSSRCGTGRSRPGASSPSRTSTRTRGRSTRPCWRSTTRTPGPPPEIYLPQLPDDAELLGRWLSARRGGRVRLVVPSRGVKRRFLEIVRKNAVVAFDSCFRTPHTHGVAVLDALADALGLETPPYRIECFDISNIQGADSVASLVVWEGGKPKKSDYRTFAIRGVRGPDDFASMAEAVTRRYRRTLAENRRLPDLVLIDGGAGQLGAAVRALAAVGLPMLPVISLAKREEEIHLQGGQDPIRLGARLAGAAARPEDPRRGAPLRSYPSPEEASAPDAPHGADRLPGVGPATARKLLRAFGSVEGVLRGDPRGARRSRRAPSRRSSEEEADHARRSRGSPRRVGDVSARRHGAPGIAEGIRRTYRVGTKTK